MDLRFFCFGGDLIGRFFCFFFTSDVLFVDFVGDFAGDLPTINGKHVGM
jgi:hypothetical protein